MPLVAGVDSSTQSCKVVIRDAETGALVRQGRASHPDGTEVDPAAWWTALQTAIAAAGGLDDVAAMSVGGQQHGMVCLDESGAVVRDALLWNDTRSAAGRPRPDRRTGRAAGLGRRGRFGAGRLVHRSPSCAGWPTHEPANAARTAAVCLPHDYLTWRLGAQGARGLDALVTDRGDASGTGYWSPSAEAYRPDLLQLAMGSPAARPDGARARGDRR